MWESPAWNRPRSPFWLLYLDAEGTDNTDKEEFIAEIVRFQAPIARHPLQNHRSPCLPCDSCPQKRNPNTDDSGQS